MPHVSLPWAPASFRKHTDDPPYLIGRVFSSIHYPLCMAEIGCSEVAIR